MDELFPKEPLSPFDFEPREELDTNPISHIGFGDMAGVPFEFLYYNLFRKPDKLLDEADRKKGVKPYFTSDDTLCAAYITEGLIEGWDKSPEERVQIITQKLKDCVKENDGKILGDFGENFLKWGYTKGLEPLNPGSPGDGAAMRAGMIGWMCNNLQQCLDLAEESCLPSHNNPESIKAAQATAATVYLARSGVRMEDIKAYIATKFNYDPIPSLEECRNHNLKLKRSGKGQDEICPLVMPLAFSCLFNSKSYEEAMQNAEYIGGDTDTIGAIMGPMAAALFGMPKKLEEDYQQRLQNPPKWKKTIKVVDLEASEKNGIRTLVKDLERSTEKKPVAKTETIELQDAFKKQAQVIQGASAKLENFMKMHNIEPDRDEILREIADARVKYHILMQGKMKKAPAPNKDGKLRGLLAEKEAVRLYYAQDQENLAKTPEERTAQLDRLKSGVLATKAFQQQCDSINDWAIKKVTDIDWTTNRQVKQKNGKYKWVQDKGTFKRVDEEKIPQKMLDDSIASVLLGGKLRQDAGQEVQPKAEEVQPKAEEAQPKVEEVQPKVEAAAPQQPEAPAEPVDISYIAATPAAIYQAIKATVALKLETGSFGEAFPALPGDQVEYRAQFKNKIDVDEMISIDLNHIGDGATLQPIMERLGFTPAQLNGFNAVVNNPEMRQLVMKELKELSGKPEESIQRAQERLNRGEFVDLSKIAQIGADAGQAIATGMVHTSLKQEDAVAPEDNLGNVLDALKKTEGSVFRYSTQSYDAVRDALTNVVKLHKKITKLIDAPDGSVDKATFNKTSEDLQKAYQKLDKAADTYLKGKSDRMIERMKDNNPDARGNKRYNIIASLRTATGPTMQRKMADRMKSLEQQITKPAAADKQADLSRNANLGKKQTSVKNI